MPNFSEIPRIAAHIELHRSDPEKARLWDSTPLGGPGLLPTLLLTTKGRTTGEPRALPLIYGESGDSYVVIGSKGGLPNHPFWFLNLEANPECELQVGRKRMSARARTIPVVVLDPIDRVAAGHLSAPDSKPTPERGAAKSLTGDRICHDHGGSTSLRPSSPPRGRP